MSSNAIQILGEIVEQQRQQTMPERSSQDYFEVFSVEQITKDYSLTFEEIDSGIVDGEHDGGVDAVYVFVNGDLIHEDSDVSGYKKNVLINLSVIQSKTAGGFSEDPINKLIASMSKMLDLTANFSQMKEYNEQVRNAFDVFRTTYRRLASRFPKLEISFHYAAMRADSEIHDNLRVKSEQLRSNISNMFEEATVSFEFLGARELLFLARQQPNQTFELKFSKSLNGDNGYVVLASLSDFNGFLRNGEASVRPDLFESNVRDFQGSTEVNKDISETLSGTTDVDFWWLNNGVTVLSSNATLVGNVVKIENPQIVNGLQTSSQIALYFDGGGQPDERVVMVKIVASGDEAVRDQIIKATNSQNSVPPASLRATDKVQRDIEHALKMGGYYYDRRKNYHKNQSRPAAKIISIPLLAQAMMSLILSQPDSARARPSSLIKEDKVYNQLFSEALPVDAYLVAADLVRRIEIALKGRTDLEARERNNLRFYCLYWVACWKGKTLSMSATKLEALKGQITDADIEMSIDTVKPLFTQEGGTDQVAKGKDFKEVILSDLTTRFQLHFNPQ